MTILIENYETKRNSALDFMKNGQLNAYFEAFIEMNNYKKLMYTVCAN